MIAGFRRALLVAMLLVACAAKPARAADRAFTARYSTNDTGDIAIVANTLMTASSNGAQSGNAGNVTSIQNGTNGTATNLNNNANYMVNVDVDSDGTTFNSSSATLNLPAGATVLFAGLYWGADTSAGAAATPSIVAGTAAPSAALRNQVRFATPASSYATLTATQLDTSTSAATRFSCFVDVTSLVASAGNGIYTVANVQAGQGGDRFAGWSMAVVYRAPGATPKNLVVFDGLQSVTTTNSVNITINGFTAPANGPVNFKMGLMTYEGDLGYSGDQMKVNNVDVSDAANPIANSFNSSISAGGARVTTKTPDYVNQLGFDADMITLNNAGNSIIANNATSATINLTTSLDVYYPVVVTTAIDLYAPQVAATKTFTDLNGRNVTPGDILEYTITIANTAGDDASASVLRDPIPANLTYVPNSIAITAGANTGAKTDAAGDDQAEFDSANNRVVIRLGPGANGTTGGVMAIGSSATITFRARVNAGTPDGTALNNQAVFSYTSLASGVALATSSNTSSVNNSKIVQGTVFEDVNYGGGAGRDLASSSGVPRQGARVELYNSAGSFVSATTTGTNGSYRFPDVAPGNYNLRVVSSTVTSSRTGYVAGLSPVQTFVNGDVNRVGGENPAKADAGNGATTLAALNTATTAAQNLAPVAVGIADLLDVDFGFNFDTVVNMNNSGQGSLRQFITNANALSNAGLAQAGMVAGRDNAVFMISNGTAAAGLRAANNYFVSGVASIAPTSTLPTISDPAVLDATRQPSWTSAPIVELNGTAAGAGTEGFTITAGNSAVRGFVINRFGGDAIQISTGGSNTIAGNYLGLNAAGSVSAQNVGGGVNIVSSANNTIGGTTAADRNVIAGNNDGSINIRNAGSTGNVVRGNYIGTNAAGDGTVTGSGFNGVWIAGGASNNTVGGTTAGDRNVISGHDEEGVEVEGSASTGNLIQGNYIGINAVGTAALPNVGAGVAIDSAVGNTVGGAAVGTGNVIGGNGRGGIIIIAGSSATGNTVQGNFIGTDTAGTLNLANTGAGIHFLDTFEGSSGGSDNNVIGGTTAGAGNRIRFNTGDGVFIESTTAVGNTIRGNSIDTNGGLGIDLGANGVTANDSGDGDTGANTLVNFPVITSAVIDSGNLILTGFARPGAAIDFFISEPDPTGFGEGKTYLLSLTEGSASDTNAGTGTYGPGTVNGLNQGTDTTNRFVFTIPVPGGVSVGSVLTATATVGSNTSEFSGNVTVATPGVNVSGFVYLDANHNVQKDGSESGSGLTLFAKIFSASSPTGPAQQAVAVDTTTGAYTLSSITPGNCTIVIDNNNTLTDVTPTLPAGWSGTEFASRLRTPVAVTSAPLPDQNFGIINALVASGRVFNDNGAGAGVANDGVRNGSETGFAGATVKLTDATGATVYDTAATNGNGDYALLVPQTLANGTTLRIVETNASGTLSTGASAGTTGGTYDRASDTITFTFSPNVTHTNVNFGDVTENTFSTDGAQSGLQGTTVYFPHTFTAGSAGQVTFAIINTPAPALNGWSRALYRDTNANGVLDSGEPVISGPIAVTAGQAVAILIKEFIPPGAPLGALDKLTVSANFVYTNASPALSSTAMRTDVATVGNPTTAGLALVKSVDKTTARPGETLTYTVSYMNNSSDVLSNVVIHDSTPAFTTFTSATNSALPTSLTGVTLNAPAVGANGAIRWTFTGTLMPGGTGTVTFRVTVTQ